MEIKLIRPQILEDLSKDDGDLIAEILKNRGIEESPEEFFSLSWKDVQTPYDLDNAEVAAERIYKAAEENEKIAMLVDCDMDGFTSSALLTNYLYALNPSLDIKHVFHDKKEHGLSDKEAMRTIRSIEPSVLFIPDASGSKIEYEALTTLGIDIVVMDHHLDLCEAPNDKVIIVNNQMSEKYENKSLSGVGVVWQVLRIVDELTGEPLANTWLDLVATGLVTDVMDLRSRETRFLVQLGLRNVRSEFLIQYALNNRYTMGQEHYNPTKIGWNIGPIFNAVTRIGGKTESELLFRSLLDDAAEKVVKSGKRGEEGQYVPLTIEALRIGANTKSRQTRRQTKLAAMIEDYIQDNNLVTDQILLVKIDEFSGDERALSGVVANKLMERYSRPILLAYKKDDSYTGSLRAPSDIPCFENFKQQCMDSGLFEWLAGHGQAAGFSYKAEKHNEIIEYFNRKYAGQSTEVRKMVDLIIDAADPNLPDIIFQISKFSDWWGTGVEEPVIAITNFYCSPYDVTLMSPDRAPTLKFRLPNGVAAIKFKSSLGEYEFLAPKNDGQPLKHNLALVGKASINEWRGSVTPQILVDDYIHRGFVYDAESPIG